MIEKLLRLLETFKDNQVANLLLSVRERIVTTINSDYFSEQSKCYFAEMETCSLYLMSDPLQLDKIPANLKDAYLITDNNKLYYLANGSKIPVQINARKENVTSEEQIQSLKKLLHIHEVVLDDNEPVKFLDTNLSGEQKKTIFDTTGHAHQEVEPFANFAHQPKKIIQIKELINALYYAQLAFKDLENVNLRNGKSKLTDLYTIYSQTIANAYKASYLFTHLDLDLAEAFGPEISVLTDLFSKIQTFANEHKETAAELARFIKEFPIAHEAGKYTGIAIDQLQPNTGKVDYSFLTQFSAVLPGYIKQFTSYLREYTAKLTDFEPNLDKQKINELEDNAVKLLSAINDLQNNDALLTMKIISYINIISHIITLSTSIIHEMGHMTETSQDVIRDNLAKIKYDYLPKLFALADKIEDKILLAPGTLSQPLMEAIVPYYQELINYASKPVDFTVKGEELLTIEDFRFINLRIKETRQRINQSHEQLIKAQQTKIAFENFFAILEKPEYQQLRIMDLDSEDKLALANYYRFLQPWFEQHELALNNEIITSFTKIPGNYDKLVNFYNWMWAPSADSVLNLLSFKKRLSDYVESSLATPKLHIQLNKNIITGIYQRADIAIRPLDPATVNLAVDDAKILNLKPEEITHLDIIENEQGAIIANPEVLTADQTLALYTSYEEKHGELKQAQEAWNQFLVIIKEKSPTPLYLLDNKTKETLRNLYLIFQPCFVNALTNDNGIRLLDKAIITNLRADSDAKKIKFPVTEQHFLDTKKIVEASLNAALMFGKTQRNSLYKMALEKYHAEILKKELKPDLNLAKRANFVIKHTKYSEAVAGFRLSLFGFTTYLNQSISSKLKPALKGIPFPELEDKNQLFAQEKQVLILKQVFNGLYHLEQICHELENLDNTSAQTVYVYHLALAYKNINSLKNMIKNLMDDPHLALIAKDLMAKIRTIQLTLKEGSETYFPDPDQVKDVPEPIKYKAIWYPLHALMLVPEHIQALNIKKPLTDEQLAGIQTKTKQIVVNIERIINSSDSYFKLLLEAPTMYTLFKELRQKLQQFCSTSHEAAMSHLKELNSELFARILLETDHWEYKLGLKPGLLSGVMKNILDEFYKGLNEPLGLISSVHIDNVTNMDAFDKRIAVNNKRAADAEIKQIPLRKNHQALKSLIRQIELYDSYLLLPPQPALMQFASERLISAYTLAYPIIMEAQPVVGPADIDAKAFPDIEKLLNELSILDPSQPKPANIHAVAVSTACYLSGVLASYQLEQDLAAEQDTYLQNLRLEQIRLNKQFVLDYTESTFEKRIDIITSRQTDLLHLNLEYNDKLRVYLSEFKEELVAKSLSSKDINATIKQLLQEKTETFQRQHLAQYTQLDNSLSVLSEFKLYFKHTQTKISEDKTSLFEDQDTLSAKKSWIDGLEILARDSKIPAKDRIEQMRNTVGSAAFEVTIMAHRKLEIFSWAWLQRLFLRILEVFHLYKPKHVKYYDNLKDALSENPELPQHRQYPGFFSETERPYELPKQADLNPGMDEPPLYPGATSPI